MFPWCKMYFTESNKTTCCRCWNQSERVICDGIVMKDKELKQRGKCRVSMHIGMFVLFDGKLRSFSSFLINWDVFTVINQLLQIETSKEIQCTQIQPGKISDLCNLIRSQHWEGLMLQARIFLFLFFFPQIEDWYINFISYWYNCSQAYRVAVHKALRT